eukprot:5096456-Pleurochrysis_carterae.AAC.1
MSPQPLELVGPPLVARAARCFLRPHHALRLVPRLRSRDGARAGLSQKLIRTLTSMCKINEGAYDEEFQRARANFMDVQTMRISDASVRN